jgi:protein-disulfide isomerase
MFDFFKKPKFQITLFIAFSLATFIAVGILYIISGIKFNYGIEPTHSSSEKYYLNKNYNEGDPFITKNPDLSEMLAGPIISAFDPSLGDKRAPVTIVVFSDFECSFCHQQEQTLRDLMEKYKDRIRIIWKDYPESDPNSVSFQAAMAARCAQEQDKFWVFHDYLFDNNKNLNSEVYYRIADLLNLDITFFKTCLESDKIKNLIKDNIAEANALDISGIPFIYVNDQEVMGEISLEELERIVGIELNKDKK